MNRLDIYLFYVILSLLSCQSVNAQNEEDLYLLHKRLAPSEIPTPNASTLGRFGDIPVSYHTGTAEVSIPIYETEQRGVKLSVNLSYDSSGLLINQLPSWTGHGWSLNAGGVITREANSYDDEVIFPSHIDFLNTNRNYFESHRSILNLMSLGYFSTSQLRDTITMRNISPDIFHFHFMGKSGRFFLGNDGKWKVDSEQNLTVVFDINNESNFIKPFTPVYPATDDYYHQPKTIKGFTILDEDGTKYVFGGTTDAIEYAVDWLHTSEIERRFPWTAKSWYLTQVQDRYGNVLYKFTYARSYFMVQIFNACFSEVVNNSTELPQSNEDFPYSSTLNAPIYLQGIKVLDGDSLTFLTQNAFGTNFASKKLYPSFYDANGQATYLLKYKEASRIPNGFLPCYYLQSNDSHISQYQFPNPNKLNDPLSSIGLKLLTCIQIRHYDMEMIGGPSSFYVFDYDTIGRLHIKDVKISSTQSSNQYFGQYKFKYKDYNLIPADYLTTSVDHWGYYSPHGRNFTFENATGENMSSISDFTRPLSITSGYRDLNTTTSQYGLLTDIVYPTGGRTHFEYEQNSFSQYVLDNRQSKVDSLGFAGGVRIKSITEYAGENSYQILTRRKFNYKNPATGTCSGVLFAKPRYFWNWNSKGPNESYNVNIRTFRSNSIVPLSNSFGPHIGYSYVTLTNNDSTKVVYHYSNLGDTPDLSFEKTFMPPIPSPYDKFGERGYSRGKLLSTTIYNKNGEVVGGSTYTYRSSGADDSFIYSSNFELGKSEDNIMYFIGGIYKLFFPKYKVERVTSMVVNENGVQRDTTTYINAYDDSLSFINEGITCNANIVKCMSETLSRNGNKVRKEYTYPLTDTNLRNSFFLPAVTTSLFHNNVKIQEQKTEYGQKSNLWVPVYEIEYNNLCTHPDTVLRYYDYTPTGRVSSFAEKGLATTYLIWDSKDRLVAKVAGNLNPLNLQYQAPDPLMTEPGEQNVIKKANLLLNGQDIFSYPDLLSSVYTYNKSGKISCISSQNGLVQYYVYDELGRLTEIQDSNKKVLRRFIYHYVTGNQ